MISDAPIYVIFRNNDSGQFPFYRGDTGGDRIIMIFRAVESAQQFIDDEEMTAEWTPKRMSQPECVEWMRQAMADHQATLIAVDPLSKGKESPGSTRVIPLLTFLQYWDSGTVPE